MNTLGPDEEARRLDAYNRGLWDAAAAREVQTSPKAYASWRALRGLPAHPYVQPGVKKPSKNRPYEKLREKYAQLRRDHTMLRHSLADIRTVLDRLEHQLGGGNQS